MSPALPPEDHFVSVEDRAALDELFARSQQEPVIVFKHSLTCPISAHAYREMKQVSEPVALVVIQRARAVSQQVETATGVRHESPQVLILRRGESVWSASHFDITAAAVAQAAQAHQA